MLETSLQDVATAKRSRRKTDAGGNGRGKQIVFYRCWQAGHIARNCAAEGKRSKQGN